MDTESRFTKSKLWELIASQRSAIYQTKSNLVALSLLTKLSVKFKRNRLPNVQDITSFSIRPPPHFCLINLFMSSLSPAALNTAILSSICRSLIITLFSVSLYSRPRREKIFLRGQIRRLHRFVKSGLSGHRKACRRIWPTRGSSLDLGQPTHRERSLRAGMHVIP